MTKRIEGYNGERNDPICHRQHLGNGYRSYSSVLMRFTCPDNWSPFRAGGMNAYSYVAGDPINHADRSGHMSWQAGLGMGLGIAGILGTAVLTGAAIVAIGGICAALETASTWTLIAGTSNLVTDVTGILSAATEMSEPRASSILGWVALSAGLITMGAGGMPGFASLAGKADGALGKWLQRNSAFLRKIQRGPRGNLSIPLAGVKAYSEHASLSQSVLPLTGLAYLGFTSRSVPDAVLAYEGVPERSAYLDVLIHAGEDANAGGRIRVMLNEGTLDAGQLHQLLRNNHQNYESVTSIRVIGCRTADIIGSGPSFAAELSDISGREVVGYQGIVTTRASHILNRYVDQTLYNLFCFSGYDYSRTTHLMATRLATFSLPERTFWISDGIPVAYQP